MKNLNKLKKPVSLTQFILEAEKANEHFQETGLYTTHNEMKKHIKNSVLQIYNRVEENGSRGKISRKVFSHLRTEMKFYADKKQK